MTATTRRPAIGVPLEELLDDELLDDEVLEDEELLEDELLDEELLEELLEEELLDELFDDPLPPQPIRESDKSAKMAKRACKRRWFLSLINIGHRIIFQILNFHNHIQNILKKNAEIHFREFATTVYVFLLLLGILFDVIHQPGHRRTRCAILLDQAGAGDPSSVNHITPDRDALHVRVVVEHWEVLLEILELILVVGVTDIVFRDIDGHLQLVPQIIDRLLHC